MSEDDREVWVVRDEESSPPSRAVSLRKLRRGVKLGKLHLDYEVARVGTNEWVTLGEFLEARRALPTKVLTESSVVTSAPNRATSEREAERILERPQRPRLRKIAAANGAHQSDGHMTVSEEEVSFHDFISEDDLEDDADDEADETSQLPPVHVDHAPGEPLPLVLVASDVPHAPEPLVVTDTPAPPEPSLRDLVVPAAPAPARPAPAESPVAQVSAPPAAPPWPSTSVVVREAGNGRVVVTDIDMPFSSMVRFMVKWAFASIPAMLLVSAVLGAVATLGFLALTALGLAVSR